MNQAISQSTNQSTLSLRVLDRKIRRRQMSGIEGKKIRTEIKRKTFLCSTEIKSLTPLLFTPLSTLRHSPYPLPSHARPHPFSTFFLFTHPPPTPHTHTTISLTASPPLLAPTPVSSLFLYTRQPPLLSTWRHKTRTGDWFTESWWIDSACLESITTYIQRRRCAH